MRNPHQSPRLQAPTLPTRWLRSLGLAVLVWCFFIALATAFGGVMSFGTGKAEELPKWNGWFYLCFCAKEGAIFGTILTWPLALIAFVVSWLAWRPERTD